MTLIEKLKTYKEFVATHEQQNDWGGYKERWVNDLSYLFNTTIENKWFQNLQDSGYAKIEHIPVKHYEEYIGEYYTIVLEITFVNNKTIVFEPISSTVLNYEGKIDMYLRGDKINKIQIFRKLKKDKTIWLILDPAFPDRPISLTKQSLEKIFDKWL